MFCPNFIICSSNENKFNGVCRKCDNARYGFFNKLQVLRNGHYPSVHDDPDEHDSLCLNIEDTAMLLIALEEKRNTTGMLNIEKTCQTCSICYEEKNFFITHPTCNIHKICDICFKKSFCDGIIKYKPPIKPECYDIFSSYLAYNNVNNAIDENIAKNTMNDIYAYNYYCKFANKNWPSYIKNIYPVCSIFDRKWDDYHRKYDNQIKKNVKNRKCPICRESKLTF